MGIDTLLQSMVDASSGAHAGRMQLHKAYAIRYMNNMRTPLSLLRAMWSYPVLVLLLAIYTPLCSGEANSSPADQLKIVHTPEELISAVNVDGFRHIVVQAHMNISATDARLPLLQLQLSTKSIKGDCPEPINTKYERGPRQCVLRVAQSFMETLDGAELHLSNLYITAESAEDPGEGSHLRQIRVRKSSVWMDTVTLEGSDDGLVEGIDVLGASSAPSLIYGHGCVFRSLRGSSGAAWSLQTKRGHNEEKPTSASFVRCVFEDNQALVKGAAFHLEPQSALLLSDCVFRNNSAPKGQDIAAEDPKPGVYASPQVKIHSSSAGKRGFSGKAQGRVVSSLPFSEAPIGQFLQGNDPVVLAIEQEVAERYTPLPQPDLLALRALADETVVSPPGNSPESLEDTPSQLAAPAAPAPPGGPPPPDTLSDNSTAVSPSPPPAQAQALQEIGATDTQGETLGSLPETASRQEGGLGLRRVMVIVLCCMVALAVIMVALLLLAMRRYTAYIDTRGLPDEAKSEAATDSEEIVRAAEEAAPPELPQDNAEVVQVNEESIKDVQDSEPPAPAIPDSHTVAFDYIDEDEPTYTDNPVFVQNVWELPPTRGFYLEDIIEERTCDLAQSGYTMAPSGLIAQTTLDGVTGDSLSPSKKLPPVHGVQTMHQKQISASSLHQSLQENTQRSLHDSLSDA